MTHSRIALRPPLLFIVLLACTFSGADLWEARAEKQEPFFDEVTLFTGGEQGYVCFRIPAIAVSTKGTILALSEARKNDCRDWDVTDLVLRRSFDNGKTWTDMEVIATEGLESVNQPCPVVDHTTGTIWMPFCKNNRRVFMMKSTDDGASWSTPVDITDDVADPGWSYVGTGPGHGIQLKSGRLVVPSWTDVTPAPMPWARDLGPESRKMLDLIFRLALPIIWSPHWIGQNVQSSYMIYSDDHGATWKRGKIATENMSDECEIVETADGSLYMNARSRHDTHRRAYAWSRDGGETWSEVKNDKTLPEPSCQGGLVRFTDQTRFQKNRVLLSHPFSTTERSRMTVSLSYDECRTWPVNKLIYEGPGEYSDLAIAQDMTALLIYGKDTRRETGQGPEQVPGYGYVMKTKVVVARFNVEWLTDGADSLQKKP